MILKILSNYKGFSTGKGGHYYSAYDTSIAIQKLGCKVKIFVFGDSDVVSFNTDVDKKYIKGSLFNQYSSANKAISYLKGRGNGTIVKLVHVYDYNSLVIGRIIADKLGVPIVYTKCGGPTSTRALPELDAIVTFHKKDYEYFTSKFENCSVILNPARVTPPLKNIERVKDFLYEVSFSDLKRVMKIGRIGKTYYATLQESIFLSQQLNTLGYKNILIFIGYVESEEILNNLHILAEENSVFLKVFREKEYTELASELIIAADIVVGNGRGAMEALSLGKPLFFYAGNLNRLCLFTKKSSEFAALDNFSERVVIPIDSIYLTEYSYVFNLFNGCDLNKSIYAFNLKYFDDNYNVEMGAQKNLGLYKSLCKKKYSSKKMWLVYFLVYNKLRFIYKKIYRIIK